MTTWQLGQFVPLRFKLIESQLFYDWPPQALKLYLYMRRWIWRSRQGFLGGYYQRGWLCVEGYLGTWAEALGASKSTISRHLRWMEKEQILRCLLDSRLAGGKKPNVYALGQVYDVPGGGDEDAIEIYYADYFMSGKATKRVIEHTDLPQQLALEIDANPDVVLIPRSDTEQVPVAPMARPVASVAQVVASVAQGVAPVQGSNREEIENVIEKEIEDTAPCGAEFPPPTNSSDSETETVTPQERIERMRSRMGCDYLTVAASCAEAQEESDCNDDGDAGWTVPPEAAGADGFTGAPLEAFCNLVGARVDLLETKERKNWARKLREIAEAHRIDVAEMAESISLLSKSDWAWRVNSFTNPYAGGFEDVIGALIRRRLAGKPMRSGSDGNKSRMAFAGFEALARREGWIEDGDG